MTNTTIIIKNTNEKGIIIDEMITNTGKVYFYIKKEDETVILVPFNNVEVIKDEE